MLNVEHIVALWGGSLRLDGVNDIPCVYLDTTQIKGVIVEGTLEEIVIKLEGSNESCIRDQWIDPFNSGLHPVPGVNRPMDRKQQWLSVLTDEQREMRKQKRFSEINLTESQKEQIGEEGCCWIESPSFYSMSKWCS